MKTTSVFGFLLLRFLASLRRIRRITGRYHEEQALIEAGAIRFRPIVLTAAAAILGSAVIVTDPVWSGLALALIFGMLASTALTLVVVPLFYYMMEKKHWEE